jgi:23S rRNA pseudouridine1911/1915/1917 synthase
MTNQTDAGLTREFVVAEDAEGLRLDRALEPFLPDFGLRQRRRLIEAGRVLVEGRPAPAGLKVRAGQRLSLLPGETAPQAAPKVPIVVRTADYAALNKPAGLHSASLAGGGGQSLEAMLPALFPGMTPRLLNRLDFLTSGLVLVSLTSRAAKVFAALKPKDMVKEYLAVVEGTLDEALVLKRKLDTDDRKRTRVLGKLDPEERNWTLVWPEARLAGGRTLVRVRIQAGARHQIRAHLAAANLPIVGDPLYGELAQDGFLPEDIEPGGGAKADERLYLHHRRLEFSGFCAKCDPPWLAELVREPAAKRKAPDIESGLPGRAGVEEEE